MSQHVSSTHTERHFIKLSSPEPCPAYWRPRSPLLPGLTSPEPTRAPVRRGRGWASGLYLQPEVPAPQAWVPALSPEYSVGVLRASHFRL